MSEADSLANNSRKASYSNDCSTDSCRKYVELTFDPTQTDAHTEHYIYR
jgi:hypothetical protein